MNRIQKLAGRFSAMQLRERRLILLASAVGLALVGFSLFVDPARQKAAALARSVAQHQAEIEALKTQSAALRAQLSDPDAGNRAALKQTGEDVARIENDLRAYDSLLVTPGTMPRLLQNLLGKHRGLELVGLRTLPVAPLLAGPHADKPAQPSNVAQPANGGNGVPPAPPPGGMYRHGMEITLAGSYADLLAYVEELQRISPRPLWSAMRLKVVEYPRSELSLTLYTLSLDLPWLAV